jgi:hypothetical protein
MLNLVTFFKRMARTASRSEVEEEDEEDRRLRPPVVVVVVVEEEEHLRTSLTEEEAVMVVVVAKRKRCLNGCDVVRLHILNASIAFSSSSSSSKGLCVYMGLSTTTLRFGPHTWNPCQFFSFLFKYFEEKINIHFAKESIRYQ